MIKIFFIILECDYSEMSPNQPLRNQSFLNIGQFLRSAPEYIYLHHAYSMENVFPLPNCCLIWNILRRGRVSPKNLVSIIWSTQPSKSSLVTRNALVNWDCLYVHLNDAKQESESHNQKLSSPQSLVFPYNSESKITGLLNLFW